MSYNSGNARRIFYTKWNKLWEEYRAAGMEEDAIRKLYEYDLAVFNNDRAHHRYDVEIPTADDSENQSDYVEYERATTVTDTYHETKTRFASSGFAGGLVLRCRVTAGGLFAWKKRQEVPPRHGVRLCPVGHRQGY